MSIQHVQAALVALAIIAICGEAMCFLLSKYFCARAAPRTMRLWRSAAWIAWLTVIPIRFGFDVESGPWQIALLAFLAVVTWVNAGFNWRRIQGRHGDRCPERM